MVFFSVITSSIIKRYRRWNRKLLLTKRQQLVILTALLTSILIFTQTVSSDYRFQMVVILSLCTYVGSAFVLREDLYGIEWLTLLTLPTLYTAAVAVFYFLLPVRWLTRIPVAMVYAVGMYALLLTENIYNVAASRTIALLRAAHSVGFILTLVTFYLLVQTVLSQRANPLFTIVCISGISFVLNIQLFWSTLLEQTLTPVLFVTSITSTLMVMELVWIFSFWPVNQTLVSLFLTTCFYSVCGIGQQYLQLKLYKKTIIEFLAVVGIVFFILIIGTKWRGF